jgi:3-hydroxybutyrate dehydrogenase
MKEMVAVITGSTSGIGLGIAKTFAEQGAKLVINGFSDQSTVDQIIKDLMASGAKEVIYISKDLSKSEGCESLINESIAHYGQIDVLVNNAGIQYVSPVETFPVDKWDSIISLNLSASFHTIRSVLSSMKSNGWGRIINIASAHGLVGSKNKSAYVAAKHGVIGLTKVVALETAEDPITCNSICPGWVKTPLVEEQIIAKSKALNISIEEATRNLLMEKQPSGQFVTPKDIGDLCLFLCSEGANQITGASISIDGAWTSC